MRYFKILKDDEVIDAQKFDNPSFVRYQEKNKIVLRCPESQAQGIISEDGSVVYQLSIATRMPGTYAGNAVEIYGTDYDEIKASIEAVDIEDTEPEVPEGVEESEIPSRAELANRVIALEEALELILSDDEEVN